MFAVLLVLPITVPEYVIGAAWVSLWPGMHGYWAAVLVMTLSHYPLVYLPAAAVLRGGDPALEETARSLGLGPWRTFARVTLPRLRLALLGGGLVIALHLLGEYGGFAVLRYRTFTTEIYNAYKLGFDAASASLLSLVLVVLCILVLSGEMGLRGHASHARIGSGAARRRTRVRLGRPRTAACLLALTGLVGLALAVPLGALAYWIVRGSSTTLPSASIWGATLNTLLFGLGAAALSCLLALPVALLAVRRRGVVGRLLERAVYVPRALPGLVVGLALVFFAVRYAAGLYQSAALLVVAYAILFLPLALVALQPAAAQITPGLEEVARGLGQRRAAVLRRVTLPLLAPGLAAAAALVFLTSVTELTATLLLRPTGTEHARHPVLALHRRPLLRGRGPYAAVMVAISAIPTYLLSPPRGRARARRHSVSAVAVTGLRKWLRRRRCSTGLALEVPSRAASTAVLGESGAARRRSAHAGRLRGRRRGPRRAGGRVVDDGGRLLAPEERRVGYVPQEGTLFPHLSAAQNVGFGLPRRRRRRRSRGRCSRWSASTASARGARTSSRAASSSASRWPARRGR